MISMMLSLIKMTMMIELSTISIGKWIQSIKMPAEEVEGANKEELICRVQDLLPNQRIQPWKSYKLNNHVKRI